MSLRLIHRTPEERSRLGFSGTDFVPIIIFAGDAYYDIPLTTITVSFYADKAPSRVLGLKMPKNYRINQVTYAGTIISILRNTSPFYEITERLRYDNYFGYNVPVRTIEIPSFDIIMLGLNETGAMSYSAIIGATISQGGYTFSIQDAYTEVVMQYTAFDFFEPIPVDVDPRAQKAAFSTELLYKHYDLFGLITESGVYVSRILGEMQSLRRKMFALMKYLSDPRITRDVRQEYLDKLDKYHEDYLDLGSKLERARLTYRYNNLQISQMWGVSAGNAIRFADEKTWGAAGKSHIENAIFGGSSYVEEELRPYLQDITEPIKSPEFLYTDNELLRYYENQFTRASSLFYGGGAREAYSILVRLENEIYNRFPSDAFTDNIKLRKLVNSIEDLKDKIRKGYEEDAG